MGTLFLDLFWIVLGLSDLFDIMFRDFRGFWRVLGTSLDDVGEKHIVGCFILKKLRS